MQQGAELRRPRILRYPELVRLSATGRSVGAWLSLLRIRTTMCAVLAALLGFATGSSWSADAARMNWLAIASAFLAIAFAQVFNDIRDRNVDAIAKPYRPIPSGAVSVRQASAGAVACLLSSLVTGALAGLGMLVLSAVMLLIGLAYSMRLKNSILAGNFAMALLSGMTFLPALAVSGAVHTMTLPGFALIFLYMLANELFKTAEDMAGDTAGGLTTIATCWGMRRTSEAIFACWTLQLGLLAVASVLLPGGLAFLALTLPLIAAPTGVAALLALRTTAAGTSDLELAHRWWRSSWTPGLAALGMYALVR